MFQFAAGRALALDRNVGFAVDKWSGFLRDAQYRRSYELGKLPIGGGLVSRSDQFALWLYRFTNRKPNNEKRVHRRCWYGDFFIEQNFSYHQELGEARLARLTWLIGYWQSPLYFKKYKELLQKELMPPKPANTKFINLALKIQNTESVALGIRLYEESVNPAEHAHNSVMKTAMDINKAIKRLLVIRPNAQFFVFCTHRSAVFDQLGLPRGTTFVTADDGYENNLDCMWLLTRCKHHIFTNSTYYWWGAWLSEAIHNNEEQIVFAADNFINTDGLCDYWQRF